MKFKLKQPTKYMHQNLENQQQQQSNENQQDYAKVDPQIKNLHSQNQNYQIPQSNQKQSINQQDKQKTIAYKHKKIIKKKNQPSALRLNKINQTFQKIYKNSDKLFQQLNIDQLTIQKLSQIKNKNKCLCDKNVKFYCLKCMTKVCQQKFPQIQLPFEIYVIHHQSQKVNKSSALPLKFLTNQIHFGFFSSLQDQKNQKLWKELPEPGQNTFILFPHKQSKLVSQIIKQKVNQKNINIETQLKSIIKNLIILDCTWFQTDQILQILSKKGYKQYLRIQNYKSLYWRYNHHNDEALSSAEAITFFMRQYQKSLLSNKTDINKQLEQGQIKKYDNLLFLYCLNLKMIGNEQSKRIQNVNN